MNENENITENITEKEGTSEIKSESKNKGKGYYSSLSGVGKAVPILLAALAILVEIFLLGRGGGMLGPVVPDFLFGILSYGAYMIPIVILIHAICYAEDVATKKVVQRIFFSLTAIISASTIEYAIRFWNNELVFAPAEFYASKTNGGFIGSIIGFGIGKIIGNIGTIILVAAILAIYATFFYADKTGSFGKRVMELKASAGKYYHAIKLKFKEAEAKNKKRRAEEAQYKRERISDALADDEFFKAKDGTDVKVAQLGIDESTSPTDAATLLPPEEREEEIFVEEVVEEKPRKAHKPLDLNYGIEDAEIANITTGEVPQEEPEESTEKKGYDNKFFGIDDSAENVFTKNFEPFDFATSEKIASKPSSRTIVQEEIDEWTMMEMKSEPTAREKRMMELEQKKKEWLNKKARERNATGNAEPKAAETPKTEAVVESKPVSTPASMPTAEIKESFTPSPTPAVSTTPVFPSVKSAPINTGTTIPKDINAYTSYSTTKTTYTQPIKTVEFTITNDPKPAFSEPEASAPIATTTPSAHHEESAEEVADIIAQKIAKRNPAYARSANEMKTYTKVISNGDDDLFKPKSEPAAAPAISDADDDFFQPIAEPTVTPDISDVADDFFQPIDEPAVAPDDSEFTFEFSEDKAETHEDATHISSLEDSTVNTPAIEEVASPYAHAAGFAEALAATATPDFEPHASQTVTEPTYVPQAPVTPNTYAPQAATEPKPYVPPVATEPTYVPQAPVTPNTYAPQAATEPTYVPQTPVTPNTYAPQAVAQPTYVPQAPAEFKPYAAPAVAPAAPVNEPSSIKVEREMLTPTHVAPTFAAQAGSVEPNVNIVNEAAFVGSAAIMAEPLVEMPAPTVATVAPAAEEAEFEWTSEDNNDEAATFDDGKGELELATGPLVEEDDELELVAEPPIEEDEAPDEEIPPEEQNPDVIKMREMFPFLKPLDEQKPVEQKPIEEKEEDFPPFDEPIIKKSEPIKENLAPVPAKAAPKKPDYSNYEFPSIELLAKEDGVTEDNIQAEIQENADKLIETLASFNVTASIKGVDRGPRITRYEVVPAKGVKVSSILNLQDDIALNLAAGSIRMEAPIPGKSAVGIEIPNKKSSTVRLRNLLETEEFQSNKSKTAVCIGRDVAGQPVFGDIAKMPHLLIAGATGMGKSVCINALLISVLYKARPDEVKLIMIDPKQVEFTMYNGIPHLLVPVVSDAKQAAGALMWAVEEMERRYNLLNPLCVRNIDAYNEKVAQDRSLGEPMSRIIIVIDEFADLMLQVKDPVETLVMRIAQKARAAGIYLVIGTQRPSVNVITGVIKANVPSRISCKVMSNVDSKTVLDSAGAEKLLDRGDMLYAPAGSPKPHRVQGAFVADGEVEAIMQHLKKFSDGSNYDSAVMEEIERAAQKCSKKGGSSDYDDGGDETHGEGYLNDRQFLDAVDVAVNTRKISTSLIQRKLSIGYGKAAKFIDIMEDMGIVGEANGQRPREVLITPDEWREKLARATLD